MQDIVFKLVPNLQDGELNAMYSYRPNFESFFCHFLEEMNRERDFYRARNLPCPKDVPMVQENDDVEKKLNEAHQESDYHRQDEQVTLCLECKSNSLKNLNRKFLRCSSQATITHLKKFIAKKVLNGIEKHKEVSDKHFWQYLWKMLLKLVNFLQIDVMCNDEVLGKDHTLKFVYVTRWRFKDPPLRLQYRPRVDPL